jgi:hypothetical protein
MFCPPIDHRTVGQRSAEQPVEQPAEQPAEQPVEQAGGGRGQQPGGRHVHHSEGRRGPGCRLRFDSARAGHNSAMGDYEASTTVNLPVDDLFEYLSRVDNLPQYMSRMTEAHSVGGDEVSVEARIDPDNAGERTVHGEAWFRIDAEHRRLEWGSEGQNDYHGELEVNGAGKGSTVVVRLHTLHDDAAAVEEGLDETLTNIRRLVTSDRA